MVKKLSILILIFFIGCILYLVPYLVAKYQYVKLVNQVDLTQNEVDIQLFLYTSKKIPMKKSLWGKNYQLKSGEYCIQYNILAIEPIDIVYDTRHNVTHIFESYE